jgi:ABC-type Fe3+/spermidine/putrescine transport system ATPase subunit
MPPILIAQNISKRFGAVPLFDNISFAVHDGDRIGLIGPNGAGKSTLLAILGAEQEPDSGVVSFRKRARIGYVHQLSDFPPGITVRQIAEATLNRVAVAASYDDTLRHGAQTPFNDQLTFRWEGGMWEYDAMHDSIVAAGNGGPQPVQARFTIFYNRGTQRYDLEQTIQPDDEMWVDIGQLIRNQVPDKNGNVLPATLTSGSYEITDLSHHGAGTIFEGKVIYDKMNGDAAYGCAVCCGYGETYSLWYDPLGIPDGGTADQGVQAPDECAGGLITDVSDSFYGNWSTQAPSIATVDYYATHTAVSVGSTRSNTSGYYNNNDARQHCPMWHSQPSCSDNVKPMISSISPSQGLVGTGISVTINGTGFAAGATVSAGSNISVSNVNVVSSSQITATFTPSNSTSAGGNQGVTVSVSEQTSNSQNFFVQYPLHLAYITEPATPNNGHSAIISGTNITITDYFGNVKASGVCGGYQWIPYALWDQSVSRITNGTATIAESFSNFSPLPDPFGQPTPDSVTVNLASGGIIADIQAIWYNPPACPVADSSDSFNQQFTATVGTVNYPLTTLVSVAESTNSQGLPSFDVSITTP